MAIADIAAYAHLSEADIEALGYELDAIRRDIEESLGESDAAYIRRTIRFQRTLDVVARLLIGCSRSRAGWVLGTASLAFAKSVENMEIGHNVVPRPMGLDERPGDPLEHVGVGHGRGLVAVEVFAQLPPPRVQQRRRHGRRPRLRRDAGNPRSAVATAASAAAASEPVVGEHLRVGHRPARRPFGARLGLAPDAEKGRPGRGRLSERSPAKPSRTT